MSDFQCVMPFVLYEKFLVLKFLSEKWCVFFGFLWHICVVVEFIFDVRCCVSFIV